MNRKQIITEILQKSSDEFETKEDFMCLAMKSKKELIKNLININNFIINNK